MRDCAAALENIVEISVSQSGRNRPLGGDFEKQGGEKKTKASIVGQNNTKGAKMLNH